MISLSLPFLSESKLPPPPDLLMNNYRFLSQRCELSSGSGEMQREKKGKMACLRLGRYRRLSIGSRYQGSRKKSSLDDQFDLGRSRKRRGRRTKRPTETTFVRSSPLFLPSFFDPKLPPSTSMYPRTTSYESSTSTSSNPFEERSLAVCATNATASEGSASCSLCLKDYQSELFHSLRHGIQSTLIS